MNDGIKGRGKWIQDTSAHAGKWNYITALSDTDINSMTSNMDSSGSSTFSGMLIPAGITIRVDASSITLTSGQLWAYHE